MDKKEKIRLLCGVLVAVLCGILYFYFSSARQVNTDAVVIEEFSKNEDTEEKKLNKDTSEEKKADKAVEVYIYICGAVKNPGVYCFYGEPRIVEVVEKAGGFTKKADKSAVNLAEKVSDGTQLVIQKKRKNKASDTQTAKSVQDAENSSDKVNLNTATREELMTLSGIGEAKAEQILSYREENGKFSKIEDIMNISGIKQGVFDKIKDRIVVG